MPVDAVLSCRNVNVRYGDVVVLRDASLDVHRGEVHVLIGPNGAGKTTLIDVITGHASMSSGEVLLDGRPLTGHPVEYSKELELAPYIDGVVKQGGMRACSHCCPGLGRLALSEVLQGAFSDAMCAARMRPSCSRMSFSVARNMRAWSMRSGCSTPAILPAI